MNIRNFALIAAASAAFATSSAQATLYDNGPSTYDFSAWTVGFGLSVSNSFALGSGSIVKGFSFDTWISPLDSSVIAVGWSISRTLFGTPIASGYNSPSQVTTLIDENVFGYKIDRNQLSINPTRLKAGQYWLTLTAADTSNGSPAYPAYWDISNGPSQAWQSSNGYLSNTGCFNIFGVDATCSSSFAIDGDINDAVPEPASWALMIAGFAMVGGAMRSRRNSLSQA